MINIPMNTQDPMDRNSINNPANQRIQGASNMQTISYIGLPLEEPAPKMQQTSTPPAQPAYTQPVTPAPQTVQTTYAQPVAPAPQTVQTTYAQPVAPAPQPAPVRIVDKPIPQLINTVQKGQKVPLEKDSKLLSIKACLGWNVTNPNCDVDVSAFMLGANGKVPGDDWFVFYGQETSPDGSTIFSAEGGQDRETISIDLSKLNPQVTKIVFVLTINEALEKSLNFSMLKDAYIRILDPITTNELVSFKMTDYYNNVTSMMIGEMYLHNGAWKFNAIGNGVAKDLAGLCEMYGVQVID